VRSALSQSTAAIERAAAIAARSSWDGSAKAWFDAWCELAR
jgi:hypothetical protein